MEDRLPRDDNLAAVRHMTSHQQTIGNLERATLKQGLDHLKEDIGEADAFNRLDKALRVN
ncbi:MAG TPA: hypothetical protein VMB03_07155 [Bryobacteraceae bacterium]|nr:hypothetical protein [Bryobacteraceae bacterium]